jgi:hypothetical protein
MDRLLAEKINLTLNTPKIVDVLVEYVNDRIEINRRALEISKDADDRLRYQGRIAELRKIAKIREDAIAVLENKNG